MTVPDNVLADRVVGYYRERGTHRVFVGGCCNTEDVSSICDAVSADPYINSQINADKCAILERVIRGGITSDERQTLSQAGFSETFISGIAGNDGKRLIHERVKALIDKLKNTNDDNTEAGGALEELGRMGADAKDAVPWIVKLLTAFHARQAGKTNGFCEYNRVELSAIDALGSIGAAEAVPTLIAMAQPSAVDASDPFKANETCGEALRMHPLRQERNLVALHALGDIHSAAAVSYLSGLAARDFRFSTYNFYQQGLQTSAIDILGKIRTQAASSALLGVMTTHRDPVARMNAAIELWDSGSYKERVAPAVANILKYPDVWDGMDGSPGRNIFLLAGKPGFTPAVAPLSALLVARKFDSLSMWAAHGLGQIGTAANTALPALEAAARDKEFPFAAEAAASAISHIKTPLGAM